MPYPLFETPPGRHINAILVNPVQTIQHEALSARVAKLADAPDLGFRKTRFHSFSQLVIDRPQTLINTGFAGVLIFGTTARLADKKTPQT